MGRADYFELGDYNAYCSECGRKRKASQLVQNWQGMYRCPSHNEPRQPQDFVRAIPDVMNVPWAQPPQANLIGSTLCSFNQCSSVLGYGVVGCMTLGRSSLIDPEEMQIPQGTWTGAL